MAMHFPAQDPNLSRQAGYPKQGKPRPGSGPGSALGNLPTSRPAGLGFGGASFQQFGQQPVQPPFQQFVRYTAPTPPPTKYQFYWNELKANYRASKAAGSARYRQKLQRDKGTRIKLILLSLAAGVGYTAFRRLRRTFSFLFMLCLLNHPIKSAIRTFPKMEQAYEQVKQGNPAQGRVAFRKALDESLYSILQDFMKPLSYGFALAVMLTIPQGLRNQGDGVIYRIIREAGRLLHIKPHAQPVELAAKIPDSLTGFGDRFCNSLRDKVHPFGFHVFNWMEK